jgi:hypothetical protein
MIYISQWLKPGGGGLLTVRIQNAVFLLYKGRTERAD